jgi:hypothetical protein
MTRPYPEESDAEKSHSQFYFACCSLREWVGLVTCEGSKNEAQPSGFLSQRQLESLSFSPKLFQQKPPGQHTCASGQ